MKGAKILSWLLILAGVLGIALTIYEHSTGYDLELQKKYGDVIMPAWKQWFNNIVFLFGGIIMLYFIKRLQRETANDSYDMRQWKESKLFAIAFIFMGLVMCVEEIGSIGGIKERLYIFNGGVILIGVLWYLLSRYLLKKELEKESSE